MPSPPPRTESPDHLPALDGLRAIAVLMVLWFHLPQEMLPDWSGRLIRVTRPGYFGVDFFFVLSGFLITRILMDYRRREVSLRVFFVRRFLRIFPAYYLLIAIMAVAAPAWSQLWAAAYLANIYFPLHESPDPLHHLWSLSVEEHFYLIWPFLVCLPPPRVAERLMTWVVLPLSIVSALWVAWRWDGPFVAAVLWQNTLPRSLSLGAGGLLALHEVALRGAPRRNSLLAAGTIVLGGASLFLGKPFATGDAWFVLRLIGGAVLSTGVVSLVICTPKQGWLARLLGWGPLRHIGLISYGLYLYHHPVYFYTVLTKNPPAEGPFAWLATPVGALLLSYAVALASYHLWERPFLRLKDLWASPKKPASATDEPVRS